MTDERLLVDPPEALVRAPEVLPPGGVLGSQRFLRLMGCSGLLTGAAGGGLSSRTPGF